MNVFQNNDKTILSGRNISYPRDEARRHPLLNGQKADHAAIIFPKEWGNEERTIIFSSVKK